MPPKKLSESDKKKILALYRQSEETTSSLATRYGVSVSTISRLLKQTLSDDEYETLIHQKRVASRGQLGLDLTSETEEEIDSDEMFDTDDLADPNAADFGETETPEEFQVHKSGGESFAEAPIRRQRRRSSAASEPEPAISSISNSFEADLERTMTFDGESQEVVEPLFASDATVLQEALEATGTGAIAEEEEEEDFDDLEDGDDLDDDDDDDDDDFAGEEGDYSLAAVQIPQGKSLRILPLSEASIPRTCYLVVDRSSELITRPLKDFAAADQVLETAVQERTLPVFDNHRVAKRFMRRMQRVVKVPDGRVLEKVSPYLQAKGITHLLIDGQVYSLS